MLESKIENHLVKKVTNELNGLALKFVSPGFNGVPDRLIVIPGGKVFFVETKSPGRKLKKLQNYVCDLIEARGVIVFRAVDTKAKVDAIIERVKKGDI